MPLGVPFSWSRARYREYACEEMRKFKETRKNDVRSMYLQVGLYFAHGCYDEMQMPDGVYIRLCSEHTQVDGLAKFAWHDMVEGRDDNGDRKVAMDRLVENAKKTLPNLTEETIRGLPLRCCY